MLFCKNFVGIHAQFSARRHVYSHALGVVPFCFAIAIEHSILLCPCFNFSGRAHSVQRMVPFYHLLRAVRVRVGQGWARIKRTSIRGQPSGGASVHGGRKLVAGLWGLVHWGIAGRREPSVGMAIRCRKLGSSVVPSASSKRRHRGFCLNSLPAVSFHGCAPVLPVGGQIESAVWCVLHQMPYGSDEACRPIFWQQRLGIRQRLPTVALRPRPAHARRGPGCRHSVAESATG